MEIKNLEQVLKLQSDLAAKLAQSVALARTGKAPSLDALLKQKEQLISDARAAVAAAVKERDAAVSRWDERVAQCQANVTRLEGDLKNIKEQVAAQNNPPRNADPGKPQSKPRTKKPG